jgi:hypothetical protein
MRLTAAIITVMRTALSMVFILLGGPCARPTGLFMLISTQSLSRFDRSKASLAGHIWNRCVGFLISP